jgi:hypothetical protein
MTNSRKPHRDQRTLKQDPDFVAKEEDKRLVYATAYADVVAYCEERQQQPPTEADWFNSRQIPTYMITCRGPVGIIPSIRKMALWAFDGSRIRGFGEDG